MSYCMQHLRDVLNQPGYQNMLLVLAVFHLLTGVSFLLGFVFAIVAMIAIILHRMVLISETESMLHYDGIWLPISLVLQISPYISLMTLYQDQVGHAAFLRPFFSPAFFEQYMGHLPVQATLLMLAMIPGKVLCDTVMHMYMARRAG